MIYQSCEPAFSNLIEVGWNGLTCGEYTPWFNIKLFANFIVNVNHNMFPSNSATIGILVYQMNLENMPLILLL